jgi:hypothetical protein
MCNVSLTKSSKASCKKSAKLVPGKTICAKGKCSVEQQEAKITYKRLSEGPIKCCFIRFKLTNWMLFYISTQ